jgi:hypothetical protein
MKGFKIKTPNNEEIYFEFYLDAAPITCEAFLSILPFTKTFFHARVSGQEIWTDNMPSLNIIQENASVFTEIGEVVLGPSLPARSKTKNCFGISVPIRVPEPPATMMAYFFNAKTVLQNQHGITIT